MDFDPTDNPCPSPPDPRNLCAIPRSAPNILAAHRDAVSSATRNNVVIHAIDAGGLPDALGGSSIDRQAALRMVAVDTGGVAVVNTKNLKAGYSSIVRETSTYYVLGYSPEPEHQDGKFHDVKVRVKRPGMTVRARKGYYAPRQGVVAREPPLPEGFSAAARDALRMPMSVRGIGIQVFLAPFKTNAGTMVVFGGRIGEGLLLDGQRQVAISYQVFGLDGKVVTGEYKLFTLSLRPDSVARVQEGGLHFVDRVTLAPGRYERRLAADQPGGSVGSVSCHSTYRHSISGST